MLCEACGLTVGLEAIVCAVLLFWVLMFELFVLLLVLYSTGLDLFVLRLV